MPLESMMGEYDTMVRKTVAKSKRKKREWTAFAVVNPLDGQLLKLCRFKREFGRGWAKDIFKVKIIEVR